MNNQPLKCAAFLMAFLLQSTSRTSAQSPAPGCAPAPSGLVSWWSLDAATRYVNPANGAPYYKDLRGWNEARAYPAVSATPGYVGEAISPNGAVVYVEEPRNLDPTAQISIDVWINPSSPGTTEARRTAIVWKGNNTGFVQYGLVWENDQRVTFRLGGSTATTAQSNAYLTSTSAIPLSQWTHVAVTYDGTAMRLFLNGIEDAVTLPGFTALAPTTSPLVIGASTAGAPPPLFGYQVFNGAIDEVGIFDRALTSVEVATLVAATSGKCPPTEGPPAGVVCATPPVNMAAWWRAEGNGQDSQGSNHLTNGGVTYQTGAVGQAWNFDNFFDKWTAPHHSSLTPASALTIDMWVYPRAAGRLGQHPDAFVFKGNVQSLEQSYGLFWDQEGRVLFRIGGFQANGAAAIDTLGSAVLQSHAWTHIAATYDGTTMRLFVNGVPDTSKATLITQLRSTSHGIAFGNLVIAVGAPNTLIDETGIFSRALLPGEIQAIYASGNLGKCVPGADSDGDGISDGADNCPTVANPDQANNDGDSMGDVCDADDDNDGVADAADNCSRNFNADQVDTDGDGVGDACDPTPTGDADHDGVDNAIDNCPAVANPDQSNTDGDTEGDICDADDDSDGVTDADETAAGSDPLNAASKPEVCDGVDNDLNEGIDEGFTNTDGDSQADCVDEDDDNDGVPDANDAFPLDASESVDTDSDGIGNNADTDDDGDQQLDADEGACGSNTLDADSRSPDADGDQSPDCVDADDDNDGVGDANDNCPLTANADQGDNDNDGLGNLCDPTPGASCSFESLRADVQAAPGLNEGQRNSLLQKLEAAQRSIARGDHAAADGQLGALVREVEALRKSGKLTPATAEKLRTCAQSLRSQ